MSKSSPAVPALKSSKSLPSVPRKKVKSYFDPLDPVEMIPVLLLNCFIFLEENCLDEVGLLRMSGRQQDTKALKTLLSDDTTGTSKSTLAQVDPHAVASLLKSYLLESPVSVFPDQKYTPCIRLGGSLASDNIDLMRDLLRDLPDVHLRILHRTLIFLKNVSEHSDKNKMDVKALAVMFGPILIRPPADADPRQILRDSAASVGLITKLIELQDPLFVALGLNRPQPTETAPSPTMQSKREVKLFGHDRNKIKIRFLLQFSAFMGSNIKGTVSLFLKWVQLGKKSESGKTKSLVYTNPQTVTWDDVFAVECSMYYATKSKTFEDKKLAISLKEVREKTAKTVATFVCNLAELAPPTDAELSETRSKTWDMLSKYKDITITINYQAEWRKVNNKFIVKAEEKNASLSRRAAKQMMLAKPQELLPSITISTTATHEHPNESESPRAPNAESPEPSSVEVDPSVRSIMEFEHLDDHVEDPKPIKPVLAKFASTNNVFDSMHRDSDESEQEGGSMRFQLDDLTARVDVYKQKIEQLESENEVLRAELLKNSLYAPPIPSWSSRGVSSTAEGIISHLTKLHFFKRQADEGVCEGILKAVAPKTEGWEDCLRSLSIITGLLQLIDIEKIFYCNIDPSIGGINAILIATKEIDSNESVRASFVKRLASLGSLTFLTLLLSFCMSTKTMLAQAFSDKAEPETSPNVERERSASIHAVSEKLGLSLLRRESTAKEVKAQISDVVAKLSEAYDLMSELKIAAILTRQFFTHVFSFMDEFVFESLINKKELNGSKGQHIKSCVGAVDSWAYAKWQEETKMYMKLRRVNELANLLILEPKTQLDNPTFVKENFVNLTSGDIYAILLTIKPERSTPKIPPELAKKIQQLASAEGTLRSVNWDGSGNDSVNWGSWFDEKIRATT